MGSIVNRGTKDEPRWYVTYKDHTGRWRMVNSKQSSQAGARKYLAGLEGRVAQGKVGLENRGPEMRFAELAAYWLETHSAPKLTSHGDNVSRMQHLLKAFGSQPVTWITADRVDEFAAKMARARVEDEDGEEVPRWQANTINRILALLRKVLNDGVRWGKLTHAPKVRLLPAPETDFDYLKREEAERFLSWTKANAPNDFPLYAAAIYTGARMGELYGLHWADLAIEQGVMTVRRSYGQNYTKSKKIRRVRLNKQLATLLTDWKRVCPRPRTGGKTLPPLLVFPTEDGGMRPRERPPADFAAHLAGAGCHEITFHCLRHTAASLAVMSGAALRFVQQQLGHSTILVTEKYAHLSPEFVGTEADRVSLDVQTGLGHLVALDGGRE